LDLFRSFNSYETPEEAALMFAIVFDSMRGWFHKRNLNEYARHGDHSLTTWQPEWLFITWFNRWRQCTIDGGYFVTICGPVNAGALWLNMQQLSNGEECAGMPVAPTETGHKCACAVGDAAALRRRKAVVPKLDGALRSGAGKNYGNPRKLMYQLMKSFVFHRKYFS
jgi:hypothetical protein